jgi:hypothetical protein
MNAAIIGSKIPVAFIESGSSSWRYPARGKRYKNPISSIIPDQEARILSRRFDAFEISISWGPLEKGVAVISGRSNFIKGPKRSNQIVRTGAS